MCNGNEDVTVPDPFLKELGTCLVLRSICDLLLLGRTKCSEELGLILCSTRIVQHSGMHAGNGTVPNTCTNPVMKKTAYITDFNLCDFGCSFAWCTVQCCGHMW